MKSLALFTILLLGSSISGMAQIPKSHPCFKSSESAECKEKIRSSIFFATDLAGNQRNEHAKLLEDFFNKYGVKGFYGPSSPHRTGSMLVHAINSSSLTHLNKQLIQALPKGEIVDGLNIYGIIIPKSSPAVRKHVLEAYIANLKLLFPVKDNEDFKITKELHGIPWEDPNFAKIYTDRIKAVVDSIDGYNRLFKSNEHLNIKQELESYISQLSQLGQIPMKVCEVKSYDEFLGFTALYGDVLKSKDRDIIECLIENKKFDVVERIIEKHEFNSKNLPNYFDLVASLGKSPERFSLEKKLFLKILKSGQAINPKKGEKQRDVLLRSSQYIKEYGQEDTICELSGMNESAIGDLAVDLEKTLFVQAYQLMISILAEKDDTKKEALIEQFSSLEKIGINMAQLHPTEGKTIMHLIAEAADTGTIKSLYKNKVSMINIGERVKNIQGETPIEVAVKSGSKKALELAQSLLKTAHYLDGRALKDLRKKVKKSNPQDESAEKQKKTLIESISSALSRIH